MVRTDLQKPSRAKILEDRLQQVAVLAELAAVASSTGCINVRAGKTYDLYVRILCPYQASILSLLEPIMN